MVYGDAWKFAIFVFDLFGVAETHSSVAGGRWLPPHALRVTAGNALADSHHVIHHAD
jgi:hypothetical protein